MKNLKMNLENQNLKLLLDEEGWTYPADTDFSSGWALRVKKGHAEVRIDWEPYKEGYTVGWENRAISRSKSLKKKLDAAFVKADGVYRRSLKDKEQRRSLQFLADTLGYTEDLATWRTTSFGGYLNLLEGCPEDAKSIRFKVYIGSTPKFDFEDIDKMTPEIMDFIKGLFDKLEDFKILNKL